MNTDMTQLRRAIDRAGGQTALARKLTAMTGRRYDQRQVWMWLHREHCPERHVPFVAMVSGVSASAINPVFSLLDPGIADRSEPDTGGRQAVEDEG